MTSTFSRQTTANAVLCLTLTSLFFASNHIFGRWMAGQVPPITLACLRWAGASAVLAPFAWPHVRTDWALIKANWLHLAALGIAGYGTFNSLHYIALKYTTATSTAILNSTVPVMIVIMAFLLYGQRVRVIQLAGIGISLAGVLVVVGKGDPRTLLAMEMNRGDLIILIAFAFWALYSALLQRRPPLHVLSFAFVTFFVAMIFNIPLAAAELALGAQVNFTPAAIAAIAFIIVFPSVLANLFYIRGIGIIGAARGGVFMHLIPMFTAAMAVMFLGEAPAPYHGIGFALILTGVWLGSRKQASPAA